MPKVFFMMCAMVMMFLAPVYASEIVSRYVPDAQQVGQGRLSVMIWDIYDAALYAPNGEWKDSQPFALKLTYLRDIKGEKIADKTIEEIRKQGFDNEVKLADWHGQLIHIFPDVNDGTTLVGVYTNDKEALFLKNDNEIGRVKDPEFSRYFFNIWFGDDVRKPSLKKKLLGAQ